MIPNSLQREIFRDFHMGHPGKNRTKSLMRCYVYCPNMDRDIVDMIESCKGCAFAAKSPTTTCKPWPKSDYPWQRIHVDFAGPIDNTYYLIVLDSDSKWPEVLQCKRPTTNCTIGFLHELFARFGVEDCVVTDYSMQFTSSEFRDFGRRIKWTTLKRLSTFWEVGIIKQRIGELIYIVQGPKKHPQMTLEPAQEMLFEWIWGITTK